MSERKVQKTTPGVTSVIEGDKENYECSLVADIIKGNLSGDQFCELVKPRAELRDVSLQNQSEK